MQVEPPVPLQRGLHGGVIVRGVVVQDQMHLEVARNFAVDGLQEDQELLVPMAGQALTDHRAGQHVQRGEQRCGAVALVAVGHRRGPTRPQGQ